MTDRRVSEDTAILGAAVATGDLFDLVDISDATDAASGTNKKIVASEMATAIGAQPLDSDLTAIAALTTTVFGRAFLALADAAATRTTLSLVPGTDVEAHDADLTTIAGLTPTNDDFMQRKAGAWANRTVAQVLTDLGIAAAYQPLDSDLTAIAALTTTVYGRAFLALADGTALAALIPSSVLTNAQLATEAQSTIKGRAAAAGTGAVTDLTATQVRTIIDTNTTPSTQALADAAAVGTADTLARGDHKHAFPTATTILGAISGVTTPTAGNFSGNVNTVATSGATQTLDSTVYAVHDITMSQSCTFTFSNPAASGKNTTFVLVLRGAFTPTLPASVKWSSGSVPTYTTPSVYVFTTVDSGTTWYSQQVGKAFA